MQTNARGAFIVIEGIDGAGTTTQTRRLVWRLNEANLPAIATFEPTDGPIGVLIRQVLHGRLIAPTPDAATAPLSPDTMTLLFSADRLDHLHTRVNPALFEGKSVVSDRYFYSTMAYQGAEGDLDWIAKVSEKARTPDLVVHLKIDPARALDRLGNRSGRDIYEKLEFLEKVDAVYDSIFANETNVHVLDATRSMRELSDEIFTLAESAVTQMLEQSNG